MYKRQLSGESYQSLERAMFLNKLPPQVRTGLANSSAPNNDALAKEANSILEEVLLARVPAVAPHVAAIAAAEEDPQPMEVSAIRQPPRPVVQPMDSRQFLCYLHSRYGTQAYSCRSSRCAMRQQVTPRRPAPGNARAGRQ